MVDYTVFDSILDSAFVVDGEGRVVYLNDPAATFAGSSVRRVVGKALISDLFSVEAENILPFGATSIGRGEPSTFVETRFTVKRDQRSGTCQLAVRPVDESHWAFFVRDVSLEEALHGKYRSELSQKEEYARNLERLVDQRTAELRRVNQTLNAILNSLGQGFFTFDARLSCGNVFTKACESVLENTPPGRPVIDVLGVPENERAQFTKWTEAMFAEYLPFDDMRALGPSNYPHSAGRVVALEYYPLRREDQAVEEIVVVATDRTTEVEARRALEAERQYAAMIVKYTKNKEQFLRFLANVKPTFERLRALPPVEPDAMNESFRALHTLEGEAGAFSLGELRLAARECQRVLEPARSGSPADASFVLRYVASLDQAVAQFDAFLEANRDVIQLDTSGPSLEIARAEVERLLADVGRLPGGPELTALYAERLFNEPIEKRLRYFDGLITTVAEKLNKRVKPLAITGGELMVDVERLEPIFSALTHVFRNAVDHGLEDPTEREWAGKDPAGLIRVDVRDDARTLHLVIRDDGRGIDPAVIRRKLAEKFPEEDVDGLSDEDVIQSTCRPGFSSREAVGEFSGRGVGLDALREEVLRLGGNLVIKSKLGEGTSIEIDLPPRKTNVAQLRSA